MLSLACVLIRVSSWLHRIYAVIVGFARWRLGRNLAAVAAAATFYVLIAQTCCLTPEFPVSFRVRVFLLLHHLA